MSLYEPSTGLFMTHVTWQDVEVEMQKALGTTSKFGKNKKATNIGDQKGFLSIIALIDPDWSDPHKNLPSSFIAKISTSLAIIDENHNTDEYKENVTNIILEAHNLEVFIYDFMEKYKKNSKYLQTMKILSTRSFTDKNPLKGFIIAEFIPNIYSLQISDSLSLEDFKPIVRSCAAFSAIGEFMTHKDFERTLGEGYVERVVNEFLMKKIRNDFHKNLKSLLLPSENDDETLQLIDEFMKIIDIYSSKKVLKKYTTLSKYLGHKPVLMHSDLWTSNILCTKFTENDPITLRALIDFQTVSISSPGLDVAALLISFLSKTDRRVYKNEILDLYYDTFCEEVLLNSSSSSIPYTKQQLENSYDLMFPIDTIFTLSTVFRFCLDSTGKVRENAIDKVIGLMEDVKETYLKNLDNFKDFFQNNE